MLQNTILLLIGMDFYENEDIWAMCYLFDQAAII